MIFVSLLFLSACGQAEELETNEPIQETDESYNDHFINDMKYRVLESWLEETTDENFKYYYPEEGMLMVAYEESDEKISNDKSREEFLEGFMSNLESAELISESEISIRDQTAYQYNLNNVWNKGEGEFTTTLIIFDYYDGIISFIMTTLSDSDKDYSSDFENVLDSIEFPEQTTQVVEDEVEGKEEVDEDLLRNEIVLGEPIDLGEYTLTIQNYNLSKDYDGNDALIIEYDWINNSEDTTKPFMTFNIKGFQDGVETDYAIMVEGADLASSQKDVRPGGSIEGAQTTVSISDMNKPLEIELDELFSFDSEPIITEIDLSDLD